MKPFTILALLTLASWACVIAIGTGAWFVITQGPRGWLLILAGLVGAVLTSLWMLHGPDDE